MRLSIGVLLLTVFSGLVGCAHPVDFKNPAAISSAFEIKRDNHDGTTAIVGPVYQDGYNALVMSSYWHDRIGVTYNKITVDAYYHGDKRGYDKANDLDGTKLEFVSLLRKVDYCDNSGCWHNEKFEITLTREYLQKYRDKGISFRVSGLSGSFQTFTVPPAYLQAYLAVVK